MSTDLDRVLDAVERLPSPADVNAVVGPVTTQGDRTLIPLAEVAYDFELTAERLRREIDPESTAAPGEGWGASRSRPVAVVESTAYGTTVRPVLDLGKLVPRIVRLVAWSAFCLLIARCFGMRKRRARC
jgi:uncharacterized spore protein YtfJ